jgi:hypothetical protein
MRKFLFVLTVSLFLLLFPSWAKAQQVIQGNSVTTSVGNPTSQKPGDNTSGDFVYYCQQDPKWANICNLGTPQGGAGCGPTSLAMVLSTFGTTMTPPEVDNEMRPFRACGYVDSRMQEALQSKWLASKGIKTQNLGVGNGKPLDLQVAKQVLDNGGLIIGSVDIHIFVVDGVDVEKNTIHVRDPDGCNPKGYDSNFLRPWHNRPNPWYYAYALKKE